MKKITVLFTAILLFTATSFAQKKAAWPEMKAFHSWMSSTFHPAEEGDLKPLKAKADSLYASAQQWQASKIPSNFKAEETTAALKTLVQQCGEISKKVKDGANDAELTKLITEGHDTFHKIAGECRKADD